MTEKINNINEEKDKSPTKRINEVMKKSTKKSIVNEERNEDIHKDMNRNSSRKSLKVSMIKKINIDINEKIILFLLIGHGETV